VRERGLKSSRGQWGIQIHYVAPRAGAWIEIPYNQSHSLSEPVAPRAGAWIEIWLLDGNSTIIPVAPRAGAWIEIV